MFKYILLVIGICKATVMMVDTCLKLYSEDKSCYVMKRVYHKRGPFDRDVSFVLQPTRTHSETQIPGRVFDKLCTQ